MVTNGTSRQSSRPARRAGRAASASVSHRRGKTCGMPCALMAIRLTACSLASEPSRSVTRATGSPKPRRLCATSTATRSPSCGIATGAGRDGEFAADLLLVDRREPAAAIRKRPENAEHALLGAVDDLDHPPAMADQSRRHRRFPRPAGVPDRRRRRLLQVWLCATDRDADFRRRRRAPPRPIRSATAINSPSRSRLVMSATTTLGSVPA